MLSTPGRLRLYSVVCSVHVTHFGVPHRVCHLLGLRHSSKVATLASCPAVSQTGLTQAVNPDLTWSPGFSPEAPGTVGQNYYEPAKYPWSLSSLGPQHPLLKVG